MKLRNAILILALLMASCRQMDQSKLSFIDRVIHNPKIIQSADSLKPFEKCEVISSYGFFIDDNLKDINLTLDENFQRYNQYGYSIYEFQKQLSENFKNPFQYDTVEVYVIELDSPEDNNYDINNFISFVFVKKYPFWCIEGIYTYDITYPVIY